MTRSTRSRTWRAVAATAAAALALPALAATSAAAPVQPHPEKPDGPITVAYVEVNNHDISNVGDYTLEGTNAPVFDIGIIFAANINYDGENAYLHFNEQVTEQLENAETLIRPLQDRGIKVVLSVLGNHQGAGFANFPDQESAHAFAQELADAVETHGLDGIDFDDEWVGYGNNGTGQPNDFSFVYLVTHLRELLGEDKLITLYDIGPSSERLEYDGVHLGDYFDYAFQPYYGAYNPPQIPGMTPDQLAPGAIDVSQTSASLAGEIAQRTVDDGYGAIITYNLPSHDISEYLSNITVPLYGLAADYQADPIPDTTRPDITLDVDEGAVTVSARDTGLLNRLVANLYDENNATFLGPIGSTSASTPLNEVEASRTWELPTTLEPGTYTVRASASDLAGNTAVTTRQFTVADPIELQMSAEATCFGTQGYVSVQAINDTARAVDIRLSTAYGDFKVNQVASGDSIYRAFPVGAGAVDAGAVTVAAYYFADGQGHYERIALDYEGVTCG